MLWNKAFVRPLMIVQVDVVLRRTVVGCDPGKSVFVVGSVDHSGWCSPEKDCCWL